jgi:hypothetical protein
MIQPICTDDREMFGEKKNTRCFEFWCNDIDAESKQTTLDVKIKMTEKTLNTVVIFMLFSFNGI